MKKKVIVHSFPPVPKAYSFTPFGIKVESYLRIKGITYDMVYTTKFGPKGKIPYIHLLNTNNKQDEASTSSTKDEFSNMIEVIPDSNIIIKRLEKEFGTEEDFLSNEERAMGHAVTRMLEEHTSQIGFYYRYVLHMNDFMEVLNIPNNVFNADTSRMGTYAATMFAIDMPKKFTNKMKMRGLLTHSDEELWRFSNDDLRAISNYLGDKKYFFGRADQATAIDCTIFAHLSQFVYIPLSVPFPQVSFMEKECPNLLSFMKRFQKQYWEDWEEKCQRQPNQKYVNNEKYEGF